jgi:hypothetical protein
VEIAEHMTGVDVMSILAVSLSFVVEQGLLGLALEGVASPTSRDP